MLISTFNTSVVFIIGICKPRGLQCFHDPVAQELWLEHRHGWEFRASLRRRQGLYSRHWGSVHLWGQDTWVQTWAPHHYLCNSRQRNQRLWATQRDMVLGLFWELTSYFGELPGISQALHGVYFHYYFGGVPYVNWNAMNKMQLHAMDESEPQCTGTDRSRSLGTPWNL